MSLLAWSSHINRLIASNRLRIILASASPRRKEILGLLLLSEKNFTTETSGFEETLPKSQFASAGLYALATAKGKARDVAERIQGGGNDCVTLVIGADTVVDLDNTIMEKPADGEHAKAMLKDLSGKVHAVHTGVVVWEKHGNRPAHEACSFICTTKVKFADLSEEAIEAYVATGEPMDKAGAYGIQGYGRGLVEWVEGDFFNVVGLPSHETARTLAHCLDRLFPTEMEPKKPRLS